MDCELNEDFLKISKSWTSHILEDGTNLVALCTASGQLLELINITVNDSCDIDRVADDISVFTSYDPLQKYYLLRCQKQLIVVKRSTPLCIIKTYENVLEVTIEDRMQIGRPQVVIRTEPDREPIITDFVGQLRASVPHTLPRLTASLSEKLQEMNARVAKVRRLLQEKRSLRYKALYRFAPHLQPPSSGTQAEPLVLAWGPPPPTTSPPSVPPLRLSRPWMKICNGKWIIGIPVLNTSNSEVCDVRLRLRQSSGGAAEPSLRYRSLVVGLGERGSNGGQWTEPHHCGAHVQTLTVVPGRTNAVVVGILEEPLLRKSSFTTLSGSIIYQQNAQSEGAQVQDILCDEIKLKVEDLIQGSLEPFSPQNIPDESDLVSVVVSSLCWQLCVSPRYRMAPPLAGALERSGLVQVKELGCWVGPRANGGTQAGFVVVESGFAEENGGHILNIYAMEMKQAVVFAHSLRGQWRVEVRRECAASVQECVASMREELCTLRSLARPGAEYSAEEWTRIRQKLNTLELATDLRFTSHLCNTSQGQFAKLD